MAVTIDDGIIRTLGQVLLIIYMTMGEQIALSAIHQKGISFHDGEIEQHLVYLCITVASHCNDLVCQVVESLHNALGVYALRYAVAGAVVDDVAQDAHHVTLLRLEKSRARCKAGKQP